MFILAEKSLHLVKENSLHIQRLYEEKNPNRISPSKSVSTYVINIVRKIPLKQLERKDMLLAWNTNVSDSRFLMKSWGQKEGQHFQVLSDKIIKQSLQNEREGSKEKQDNNKEQKTINLEKKRKQ